MDNPNPGNKVCSSCRAVKLVTAFNFKYHESGVRHSFCREGGKSLMRSHYKRNKRSHLDRNALAYQRHRALIREAKSRPCADCGVQHHYYVMDFDQRDDVDKVFELHFVTRKTARSILREIETCDAVCADCHRGRTHRRTLKASPSR